MFERNNTAIKKTKNKTYTHTHTHTHTHTSKHTLCQKEFACMTYRNMAEVRNGIKNTAKTK